MTVYMAIAVLPFFSSPGLWKLHVKETGCLLGVLNFFRLRCPFLDDMFLALSAG